MAKSENIRSLWEMVYDAAEEAANAAHKESCEAGDGNGEEIADAYEDAWRELADLAKIMAENKGDNEGAVNVPAQRLGCYETERWQSGLMRRFAKPFHGLISRGVGSNPTLSANRLAVSAACAMCPLRGFVTETGN